MSNLITTLIAVALAVLMAGVGLYYGGEVFSSQEKNVASATVLNNANQLSGFIEAYHNERGTYPDSMDTLVSAGYLKSAVPGTWTFETDYVVTSVPNEAACLEMNQAYGISTVPTCGDPGYEGKSYCCTD